MMHPDPSGHPSGIRPVSHGSPAEMIPSPQTTSAAAPPRKKTKTITSTTADRGLTPTKRNEARIASQACPVHAAMQAGGERQPWSMQDLVGLLELEGWAT